MSEAKAVGPLAQSSPDVILSNETISEVGCAVCDASVKKIDSLEENHMDLGVVGKVLDDVSSSSFSSISWRELIR